mgnify:FL=1
MTAPRVDEVRYDLSALDPAERFGITSDLEDAGITFEDFEPDVWVITVSRSDEALVDQIIEKNEEWGRHMRGYSEHAEVGVAAGPGASPNQKRCEGFDVEYCGNSPAETIVLRRVVGQVIVQTSYQVQLVLCDACGEKAFKSFQKQTAAKGWLSTLSVVTNPVVIATNLKNRKNHRRALLAGGDNG